MKKKLRRRKKTIIIKKKYIQKKQKHHCNRPGNVFSVTCARKEKDFKKGNTYEILKIGLVLIAFFSHLTFCSQITLFNFSIS